MIWTGSPGVRWSIRNTPTLRMTSTGAVPSSRPIRKRAVSGLPGRFEAHQSVRCDLEALDGRARGKERRLEPGEDVRRVVVDGLLDLLEDLLAAGLVGGRALLGDAFIEARVGV